jgi:hypothetical protein
LLHISKIRNSQSRFIAIEMLKHLQREKEIVALLDGPRRLRGVVLNPSGFPTDGLGGCDIHDV